ncbi:MAG TPA: PLP-dependent aminotransferase family protein, partial [Streptosporangiaceae bacterium]|nr:PLP-dependent aminotransferase family protein [Streptosporangiaceae bacterium]
DGVDAKAMLPRAISARVAYVPGTGFYADGSGGQFARLCYAFPPPDRIREGIRRLAGVVEGEVELRQDFAPSAASSDGPGAAGAPGAVPRT